MSLDGSPVAPVVAVVDYGIGNLHSAHKALQTRGADARLTTDPAVIATADGVVLPGVGAFGACMAALRSRGLEAPVRDAAASGRPFMGICVGMQMLFDASDEDPGVAGLGILSGRVQWIPAGVKRPQMQWNRLEVRSGADPLLDTLDPGAWMYFVHSLHSVPDDAAVVTATCDYGGALNAAFRRDNVVAYQFHPEKSAATGLALMAAFVSWCATGAANPTSPESPIGETR